MTFGLALAVVLQRFNLKKEALEVASTTRIDELQRKHATLEDRLEEETHRPAPDQTVIMSIKREKLKLKDEIAHLQRA